MTTLLPKQTWGYDVNNFVSAFAAATIGTNFTAGGNNTFGSSVSVISSAITYDLQLLTIEIGGTSLGAQVDASTIADILYDPAGGTSWSTLISGLLCGFAVTPGSLGGTTVRYSFPIRVPAGSTLGIKAKTAYTSDVTTGRVLMTGYGRPSQPSMWWCGSGVETLGISSSKGTSVTPGASGANGSWTTIGTSSFRYRAFQIGVGPTHSAMVSARGYHTFVGVSSAQLPGSVPIHCNTSSTHHCRNGQVAPQYCDIPSGSTIQAMSTCSSTSPDALSIAVYGVY